MATWSKSKQHPGWAVLSSDWPTIRRPSDHPKTSYHMTWSRGMWKSDPSLFISILSNMVHGLHVGTLAKSTGPDWWLCVDTQKHQVIDRDDQHNTLLTICHFLLVVLRNQPLSLTVSEIFNIEFNAMVDMTLIRPLRKGQGHSFWYQSISHIRLPIGSQ